MPSFRPFVAGHLALTPGTEGILPSLTLMHLKSQQSTPNKMVKSIAQCLRML